MSSKIARKHTRRWLDGQPSWVVFAIAALAVLPVLVWLAHPEAAGYPDAIATVVGIVLTAVVFMLTAAQNAQKRALDTVVSEFAARDERVRKAAAGDDPEPWPAQMNHELRYVDTVAAIAALRPVERRWRRRNRQRRKVAQAKASWIRYRAAGRVRDVLSQSKLSATCGSNGTGGGASAREARPGYPARL